MKVKYLPLTIIELIKLWPHAKNQGHKKGQVYRIGYYSKQDGLNVIWLVDDNGEYIWTVDNFFIEKHFKILEISDETDIFGDNRPQIGAR